MKRSRGPKFLRLHGFVPADETPALLSLSSLRKASGAIRPTVPKRSRTSLCIAAEDTPKADSRYGNAKGSELPTPEETVPKMKDIENAASLPP